MPLQDVILDSNVKHQDTKVADFVNVLRGNLTGSNYDTVDK